MGSHSYLMNLQGADLRTWMPRASNPQHLNEALTATGPNTCRVDSQCDGFRTCSGSGWCQGWAGVEGVDYNVRTPTHSYLVNLETNIHDLYTSGLLNSHASRFTTTNVGHMHGDRSSVISLGLEELAVSHARCMQLLAVNEDC